MEKCSNMHEVNNYNTNLISNSKPINFGENLPVQINIEAHTSNNMKVERPKVTANFLQSLPMNNKYSYKEADNQLRQINTDIYEGTKKEKSKHEFNAKRYFTIFGILALLTAAITCFRKGK